MIDKGTIAVVGAGPMGAAIATLYAAHGYQVALNDQNRQILDGFPERATPAARHLASSSRSPEDILSAVTCNVSLEESVKGAFLVQEAIHEDLEAKRALFQSLDRLCSPNVLLATNTSSFLLSEICEELPGRGRIIGIHYVAPAHLIRAVEIITAAFTEESRIAQARTFVESVDHVGIVCRERPGFLINSIQYALKAEVARIVEEGVASVEDIDAAVRLSIGPRLALWGPMMQEDLSASKKTVLAVTEYIHNSTGQEHYASTPTLRTLAESGQIGAMSGAGWYRWEVDFNKLAAERDDQLGRLLDWLKANDRRAAFGSVRPNEAIRKR